MSLPDFEAFALWRDGRHATPITALDTLSNASDEAAAGAIILFTPPELALASAVIHQSDASEIITSWKDKLDHMIGIQQQTPERSLFVERPLASESTQLKVQSLHEHFGSDVKLPFLMPIMPFKNKLALAWAQLALSVVPELHNSLQRLSDASRGGMKAQSDYLGALNNFAKVTDNYDWTTLLQEQIKELENELLRADSKIQTLEKYAPQPDQD